MQTRLMERNNSMRGKRSLDGGGGGGDDEQPERKRPALARCRIPFSCARYRHWDFCNKRIKRVPPKDFDKMMEERYKDGSNFVRYGEDDFENKRAIDRNNIIPSARDPTIWKVKCMVGRERNSAFCLMQKYGKYKGDLAQIVAVNDARKRATVKLIPRIDLQAMTAKIGGGVSLKKNSTPAPRLISTSELE